MQAKVIGFQDGTATTQPILIIQYLNSGSDNETESFADSENISADISITHNTTYGSAIASATTHSTNAQVGSSVKVEEGVYFIRGQFVRCVEQTLLLSANSRKESVRVGFHSDRRTCNTRNRCKSYRQRTRVIKLCSLRVLID